VSNSIGAVLPGMLQRQRGHLVAISSLASYCGVPRMAGYCASKAGVNALMDALRVELKPQGVLCTTICPGWIETPMTANVSVEGVKKVPLAFAVRQLVRAIRARRSFPPFGGSPLWEVGMMSGVPRSVRDWLVARMMKRTNLQVRPADG